MQSNPTLPPDLQQILERELAPGERIVWMARPGSWNRIRASVPTSLMGIFFLAFTLSWMAGAARHRSAGISVFDGFDLLWDGAFGLVGVGLLLSPLWAWWVARHTLYAITDRRALLIEAPWRRTIQSFTGERLVSVVRRENRRGCGDILFERIASRGGKGGPVYRDIGFFGLSDARGVEELLRKTHDQSAR